MNDERRGIGSVEVGGQLLRALTEFDGPMMLKELAQAAGMPPAKAHPYLVSFARIGLVEQDRISGRYELGPLALQMGLACMRRLDPVRIATEAVTDFVRQTNHTTALAVWGNHGPTLVRLEEGSGAIHVNLRVGSVMSLLGTATGNVFAAFLPPKLVENFIASGVGHASVGDAVAEKLDASQVEKLLADVRKRGLARSVERPVPGVNAFCAPVFDNNGSIALAITTMGPASQFDARWDSPVAAELLKCAAAISNRLGFSGAVTKVA